MTQLDDFTRRALCAADQPPPGVEDRILASILGPMGGPGSDGGGGGGGLSSGPGLEAAALGHSTIAYAIKVVGATLGLAAGGLALLAATAAGVRSIADGEQSRASAPIEIVAAPLEQPVVAAAIVPEPEPTPAEPAPPEQAEPAPLIASAPALAQKPGKLAAVQEDTIEAELALLKVARESKDHELALVTLDRHRSEFANGVFAAEREVLRVEHLCALGRVDEAQTVANAFIARHPENPLRSRVDPACGD